jgi:hypothetical protein
MRIISIDVGIKNLAFCLFSLNDDKSYEIENWGVVDLSQKTEIQRKCTCFNEKKPTKKIPFPPKEKCNFQAKWKRENTYYCVKHAKQSSFLIPTNDFKTSYINKQNISSLKKIMDKLEIKYDILNLKKIDMISFLLNVIREKCLEPIEEVNASKMDLVTIGMNMKIKFNDIFSQIKIDKIIIENQISPIANRMKTIQGMISQYFIMKGNVNHIEFISSANKLKDLTSSGANKGTICGLEKNKEKKKPLDYKDRKKAGIEKCLQLLNEYPLFQEHFDHFQKHKKKDDLADCFLQGYWYISEKLVG